MAPVVEGKNLVGEALDADLDLGGAEPPEPHRLSERRVIGAGLDRQPDAAGGGRLVGALRREELAPGGALVRIAGAAKSRDDLVVPGLVLAPGLEPSAVDPLFQLTEVDRGARLEVECPARENLGEGRSSRRSSA